MSQAGPATAVPAGARLRAAARSTSLPLAGLVAIFGLSFLVYALLAQRHVLPNLMPDETIYARLSQSFAAGDGLSWRGTDWGLSPLYPIVLSPVWHLGSTPEAYKLAKLLGVLLASLTVIPVWLLARELVGPRLALIPAALCVTGAWMETTAFVIGDNLAYPLATASLAATVMALRRPSAMRWIWISLAFAVPAVLTRTQLLVLPVILVVALVVDVALQPRGERRARFNARPTVLWIGLGIVIGGGLLAFVVHPNITRYAILTHHVTPGQLGRATAHQAVATIVLFGVVPLVAAVALMAHPSNWRNSTTGPLLTTLAATTVVLLAVLGRFEAYGTNGPVDRYVMYLAPLVFVALVLAAGRVSRWVALGSAVVLGLSLFALPHLTDFLQQPSLYGIDKRVSSVTHHVKLGVVVVGLAVGLAGAVALTLRDRRAGLTTAVLLTAAVMIAEAWTAQHFEIYEINRVRPLLAPHQLDWVDRRVSGPVAALNLGKLRPFALDQDLQTEFFNRNVKTVYSTVRLGRHECRISLARSAYLVRRGNQCAAWPRHLVVFDAPFKHTFVGQRVLASTALRGSLIDVPPGAPRVLAILRPPCKGIACYGALSGSLHLATGGTLTLAFRGGSTLHHITLPRGVKALSPGRMTVMRISVPRGWTNFSFPVDWSTRDGAPQLQRASLASAGAEHELWGAAELETDAALRRARQLEATP